MNNQFSPENTSQVTSRNDLVNSFIEVKLADKDAFLKIRETLTRIGIANLKSRRLTQTAHILHKGGKYYIVHFMQLFMLDEKPAEMNKDDYKRVYAIAELLKSWDMLEIVNEIPQDFQDIKPYRVGLTIIDYKSKSDWELKCNYTLGNKRYNSAED